MANTLKELGDFEELKPHLMKGGDLESGIAQAIIDLSRHHNWTNEEIMCRLIVSLLQENKRLYAQYGRVLQQLHGEK